MKRLVVNVGRVENVNGKERVTLTIGDHALTLTSPETADTRALSVALYTAKCVTLEVDEGTFKIPESFS